MTDDPGPNPSRGWTRVTVYADLNCPFCFALEERLLARGVDRVADWKLVEHAPDLPKCRRDATPSQHSELAAELVALAERAPDVEIARPPFRSNSGAAIAEVARAMSVDPVRASDLRRRFFVALWREGLDISSADVRQRLVEEVGLRWQPTVAPEIEETTRAWTTRWRDARYDRIPCMVSDTGTKLLGLASEQRLDLFLRSGLFSSSAGDACNVPPKGHAGDEPPSS